MTAAYSHFKAQGLKQFAEWIEWNIVIRVADEDFGKKLISLTHLAFAGSVPKVVDSQAAMSLLAIG